MLLCPTGALSWQRTRAACMLAFDGPSFAKYIATENSGTYNNQVRAWELHRRFSLSLPQTSLP